MKKLADGLGRKINYLRLSVTDHCNMRCVYCVPEGGVPHGALDKPLDFDQFLLISRAAVSLGIKKIRVTGGEPLVRKGIVGFLRELAGLPGLERLVLTTNGLNLAEMAQDLKDAGVQSLNISLDSLEAERFCHLTRRDCLDDVLAGIEMAEKVGLRYKINTVIMRGRNDHEIPDFAKLAMAHNCSVRFIEYMPVMKEEGWQSLVMPSDEVLQRLREHHQLEQVNRDSMSGPAREFRIDGTKGKVGVISPLSGHFCGDCNRIRITSTGKVRTCLFSDQVHDLVPLLETQDIDQLAAYLLSLVSDKPARHCMDTTHAEHTAFSMSEIGG